MCKLRLCMCVYALCSVLYCNILYYGSFISCVRYGTTINCLWGIVESLWQSFPPWSDSVQFAVAVAVERSQSCYTIILARSIGVLVKVNCEMLLPLVLNLDQRLSLSDHLSFQRLKNPSKDLEMLARPDTFNICECKWCICKCTRWWLIVATCLVVTVSSQALGCLQQTRTSKKYMEFHWIVITFCK